MSEIETPKCGQAFVGDPSVGLPPELETWQDAHDFCVRLEKQLAAVTAELAEFRRVEPLKVRELVGLRGECKLYRKAAGVFACVPHFDLPARCVEGACRFIHLNYYDIHNHNTTRCSLFDVELDPDNEECCPECESAKQALAGKDEPVKKCGECQHIREFGCLARDPNEPACIDFDEEEKKC